MQSIAEEGIAAHWKYKEGRRGTHTDEDEAFVWLKRLVEWQQEVKDSREFLDSLCRQHVLEFNPAAPVKGPRYSLKKGKTPVLTQTEARQFLNAIDVPDDGKRNRLTTFSLSSGANIWWSVIQNTRDVSKM